VIGVAWTWVSNIFTMWPTYYLFYLTGKLLTGEFHDARGYQHFVGKLQALLAEHGGFVKTLAASLVMVAHDQGVPMLIGCVPWAIATAWLGYWCTLRYVHRRRRVRSARRHALWLKRAAAKAAAKNRVLTGKLTGDGAWAPRPSHAAISAGEEQEQSPGSPPEPHRIMRQPTLERELANRRLSCFTSAKRLMNNRPLSSLCVLLDRDDTRVPLRVRPGTS
jgi:hypothetical protein